MKTFKAIIAISAALLIMAPAQTAQAQKSSVLSKVTTALTSQNGINAGKALLGLYTQFKADGNKFNFQNSNNINNLLTLAGSIQGLKNGTENVNTTNFLSGLISGSNNLVNKNNSSNVLSSLTSLANVDLSSLTGTVASSAASSAVSSLLSKTTGGTANTASASSAATDAAGSILSSLFGKLVK